MEKTFLENNENKINDFISDENLTCLDCPYIPSIKMNSNQHSINIECQNNIKITSDSISGHFHDKILLKDYLKKLRKNNENNKKECSLCKKSIKIENIYYCSFCKAFICQSCINDKHSKEKNDHPTLKFELINTYCCIHKKKNRAYCRNCFKNICEDCLKYNKHKNHDIINLDDILIDDEYLKKINEEINNEENEVTEISKQFNNYMDFIQKKFDNYIQLRNDEINLKKNIIHNYNKYKNNYNSIMNVKKLKFDYFKFYLDNEEKNDKNKNKNKLKNFEKLINELILYEQTKNEQKNRNKNTESQDEEKNNIKAKEKEKEKIKCFKENSLLKSSKYEIVNKINLKCTMPEKILCLKNNKLLIAYSNRDLVIYNKNDLKNNLEELCKVNLANIKCHSSRSFVSQFKEIYQLKNENIVISMAGLSNFILSVDYNTKTFKVVQEFMIGKALKLNNSLFENLPEDPNNYDDVIPEMQNSSNLIGNNVQLNINYIKKNTNTNITHNNTNNIFNNNINSNINKDNIKDNLNDNLNINNIISEKASKNIKPINNITNNKVYNIGYKNENAIHNNNLNNTINNIQNQNIINNNIINPRGHPRGFFQGTNNLIRALPFHPMPHHHLAQNANNTAKRKRTLINLVALQNDDLLAISHRDCWILRHNSQKYVIHKENIIYNYDNTLSIKKALPISDNEFVIEIVIDEKKIYNLTLTNMTNKNLRKNNFVYIFYNLNYEEIQRKYLSLYDTLIRTDNDYIYIKDQYTLLLMDKKNKEVINVFEIDSMGPIIPMKSNKSFIVQEKENNTIVEYRIIDNEIVKSEKLIGNACITLIEGIDDDFNTLIIQFRDESLLFLQ